MDFVLYKLKLKALGILLYVSLHMVVEVCDGIVYSAAVKRLKHTHEYSTACHLLILCSS